jgi:hypothetical protein
LKCDSRLHENTVFDKHCAPVQAKTPLHNMAHLLRIKLRVLKMVFSPRRELTI